MIKPDFELFGIEKPQGNSAISTPPAPPGRQTIALSLKLITPMFGGASDAGKVDPRRPVNAKSIRGHLRFWWRACRAGQFNSVSDMYKREARIWGAAAEYDEHGNANSGSGLVDVSVVQREAKAIDYSQIVSELSTGQHKSSNKLDPAFSYVLFPFEEAKPQPPFIKNHDFQIIIGINTHRNDIDEQDRKVILKDIYAAIWAWLTFGGIGTRTRRGLGSLQCQEAPVELMLADSIEHLCEAWMQHVIQKKSPHEDIPSLYGARLLFHKEIKSSIDSWKTAVSVMRKFRQGGGQARENDDYGASLWPEAKAAKRFNRSSLDEKDFFPRSDLGLPIIMHFPQEKSIPDMTIYRNGTAAGRMASPIITKCLPIGGMFSPIIVQMTSSSVVSRGVNITNGTEDIDITQRVVLPDSLSVKPMGSYKNVREAFWEFAKNKWGSSAREVKF